MENTLLKKQRGNKMVNWETEYFVKITPRRKNDWGFASIGNDYNNFNSAEEYIKYYEKTCQNIVDNIKEHYNDFDIKYVEVATNEHEQELEEKVDSLKDELADLKGAITDVILNAHEWKSVAEVLNELNKILGNKA